MVWIVSELLGMCLLLLLLNEIALIYSHFRFAGDLTQDSSRYVFDSCTAAAAVICTPKIHHQPFCQKKS